MALDNTRPFGSRNYFPAKYPKAFAWEKIHKLAMKFDFKEFISTV